MPRAGGVELAAKVTPKAGRARVDGVAVDAALRALLAKSLGVAPSAVEVVAGATARRKRLRVAGDPAALAARLEALAGTEGPAPR